eukprot:g3900.t1
MSSIYYRAGQDRKGSWISASKLIKSDPYREEFCRKLRNDSTFRTKTVGWKGDPDDLVREYKEHALCPGGCVKGPEVKICQSLYLLGTLVDDGSKGLKENEEVTVLLADGTTEQKFGKEDLNAYDESHDCPSEELPDDVCAITGFGEASLLKIMRRRFVETLNIYTYVGDIVLCLNPYMLLPEMVHIEEYPNQKDYVLGVEPNTYATAYFAYHGQYAKGRDVKKNQSCIVSGESGAGKTVACGFIMKYLAKLSNWRKLEKGETSSQSGDVDVTSLVAGVSPFLEAFGNAKTNMNDNSSRFGKFTKIWFQDGKIVGAELEHYLLEKARICTQGSGERNYHIFYYLLRGGRSGDYKECETYKLKQCEDYPHLVEGGSSEIGHGLDATYDIDKFNAELQEDPDDTGVRAALTNAQVSESAQQSMWRVVAAVLKLLLVNFQSDGDGSSISNTSISDEVSDLLAVDAKDFKSMLCIYRLSLPGGITTDKLLSPDKAMENRNSLAKDLYGNLFKFLFDSVCKDVLSPKDDEKETFVGLLDIFGFEVMVRNSIEQLCINFANERLQYLFNEHIFSDERKTFLAEGIDESKIPSHKDNAPCCNLVVKKTKKFMGILHILNDLGQSSSSTDKQFVEKCAKRFGKKFKVNKKAKDSLTRQASAYFATDAKYAKDFYILHYAGKVKYSADGFLYKNKDRLAPQLTSLMKGSKIEFISNLFEEKKEKKKKSKTLAGKYMAQLSKLSATIQATKPNYVRCVKPNDIHFRPVDGLAAFDEWKTYRQLLYAGVMEVVKIKTDGFPFHMLYETFWKTRIVSAGAHRFLQNPLPDDYDPKEGTEAICKEALPMYLRNSEGKESLYWTLGNTMVFGKQGILNAITLWQQQKVAKTIHIWSRINHIDVSVKAFLRIQKLLVTRWKAKVRERRRMELIRSWFRQNVVEMRSTAFIKSVSVLTKKWKDTCFKKRLASFEKGAYKVQSMVTAIKWNKNLKERRYRLEAVRLVGLLCRRYNALQLWRNTAHVLRKRKALQLLLREYRNYKCATTWMSLYYRYLRYKSMKDLSITEQSVVVDVNRRLSMKRIGARLLSKLHYLRLIEKTKACIRLFNAKKIFEKKRLEYKICFKINKLYSKQLLQIRLRKKLHEARLISVTQCLLRTFIAREQLKRYQKQLRRETAAIKIQTQWRRREGRRRFMEYLEKTCTERLRLRYAELLQFEMKRILSRRRDVESANLTLMKARDLLHQCSHEFASVGGFVDNTFGSTDTVVTSLLQLDDQKQITQMTETEKASKEKTAEQLERGRALMKVAQSEIEKNNYGEFDTSNMNNAVSAAYEALKLASKYTKKLTATHDNVERRLKKDKKENTEFADDISARMLLRIKKNMRMRRN